MSIGFQKTYFNSMFLLALLIQLYRKKIVSSLMEKIQIFSLRCAEIFLPSLKKKEKKKKNQKAEIPGLYS